MVDTAPFPIADARMDKKSQIDVFGAVALTGFAFLLAFNQVVIKVTNGGIQPVFFAGLRSLGAVFCLWLWLKWRGIPLRFNRETAGWGVLTGAIFGFEFLCLFVALDLTTVGRTAVIFYSMPVWLALIAHFVVPDDRLTPVKSLGLLLAVAGVAGAMLDRDSGEANLWGDLAALGAAIGWAATAMLAKASPLRKERPEMQLFWQVLISGPLLIAASLFFGDLIRDLQPVHIAGLVFQIVIVVTAGFVFWLWLLSVYPASSVASFSFLSPVLSVVLGWLMLGEEVGSTLLMSLVLVAIGIFLINRPTKASA